MSLLIPGLELPKEGFIELAVWFDGNVIQTGETARYEGEDYYHPMRQEKLFEAREIPNTAQRCPLIELPPHGRLIDADELVADIKGQAERLWTLDSVSERDYFIERNEKFRQAMFKAWCESLFAYLDTRPTIIEAEGVSE